MSEDKSKALAAALAQIEKNFGKGAIMKMDGSHKDENLEVISTGSWVLDLALGVGGLPRGRIVEIYGPESSGKTTMCLEAIAQCQKSGGVCAFIDAENAFDPIYARKLGVKVEDLLVSQPDTGEQALEICDMLVRSGGVDMVVIDSVAALGARSRNQGEMGDSHVGLQARLMSQALRKLTGNIKKPIPWWCSSTKSA
jgi:recombination protein RecA